MSKSNQSSPSTSKKSSSRRSPGPGKTRYPCNIKSCRNSYHLTPDFHSKKKKRRKKDSKKTPKKKEKKEKEKKERKTRRKSLNRKKKESKERKYVKDSKENSVSLLSRLRGGEMPSELEEGLTLQADTYWISNVHKSTSDRGNHISWFETNGGGATAKCCVYGCGNGDVLGGHVRLARYKEQEFYFILPICASHNQGGKGGSQYSMSCHKKAWAKTKGRVKPVARRWRESVPKDIEENQYQRRTLLSYITSCFGG
mmetsp:Transcript_7344/g.11153  ORF Transcript_7344/g.11153 Transcript_7344/m.11153 type:complete len:255 (+) Transcript_7344:63-827(+)